MKINLDNKLKVLSKERQEERQSTESHKNNMIFDKEKSNNECLTNEEKNNNVGTATQTKSVINENKDNLFLECDHDINNYKHHKNNNKKYKVKYTELSIKKTTNAKENLVNNPLTYQTISINNNVTINHSKLLSPTRLTSHNQKYNTSPSTKKIKSPTSKHSRGKDRYQSIYNHLHYDNNNNHHPTPASTFISLSIVSSIHDNIPVDKTQR